MVASNEECRDRRRPPRATAPGISGSIPIFMINCYAGYMDTNLVIPIDVDHCTVVFDFYFADIGEASREYNEQSVNVGNRVQEEDLGNLRRRAAWAQIPRYRAGRLSVRREAGEQLFHRLLAADLKARYPDSRSR